MYHAAWMIIILISIIFILLIIIPMKNRLNLSGIKITILFILSLFIWSFFNPNSSIFVALALLYATIMIWLQDIIKVKINKLFIIGGLVLAFLVYVFIGMIFTFNGINRTVIISGIVGSLSILTFYIILPRTHQDKYQYFMELLKYLFFILVFSQLFLLWSADRAYTKAKEINIKHVENKTVLDFYSPTMKEIRIASSKRWSYRRAKYVNE